MSECCKSGFKWSGSPEGKEGKLGKNDAYITGSNKDAAVLIVHDIFGWTLPNVRILADHYAKEADVTTFVPDFFGGEVVTPETMEDEKKRAEFDLWKFIGRNSKEIRGPEIFAAAEALKKEHGFKKVAAIGFCYGGWAVFQLGAKGRTLVDAISTAHPSILTKEEIDAVDVPVQILAPQHDQMYTQELKDYSNKKIPELGLQYDYQYFPNITHGFAVRGDPSNPVAKQSLERAKNAAVGWFVEHLHESKQRL